MRALALESPLALSTARPLIRAAAYGTAYFVAMVGSIWLGRFGAEVTPIWIASAIFAWALLMSPQAQWLSLTGFVAIAHVLGALVVGDQVTTEFVYLAANLASPLLLATLMRWRGDALAFNDRNEVLRLLLFGGVLAPGFSTSVVTLHSVLTSGYDPRFSAIWFLSDALSFIVFLPLFKAVNSNGWKSLFAPERKTRALILFSILIAAHALTVPLGGALYAVFLCLLIPYLIFIAFELGLTGARTAVAGSAVLMLGLDLFVHTRPDNGVDPQLYLLALQIYVAATVACVLPLAAALDERQRLYETASAALNEAQQAWGEIIAAEAHFRLIADNTTELILRMDGDGRILFASPACRALSDGGEHLAGRNFFDLAHAEDATNTRAEHATLVADGIAERPRFWQLRLRDMNDEWRLFDLRATLVAPGEGEFIAVLRQV